MESLGCAVPRGVGEGGEEAEVVAAKGRGRSRRRSQSEGHARSARLVMARAVSVAWMDPARGRMKTGEVWFVAQLHVPTGMNTKAARGGVRNPGIQGSASGVDNISRVRWLLVDRAIAGEHGHQTERKLVYVGITPDLVRDRQHQRPNDSLAVGKRPEVILSARLSAATGIPSSLSCSTRTYDLPRLAPPLLHLRDWTLMDPSVAHPSNRGAQRFLIDPLLERMAKEVGLAPARLREPNIITNRRMDVKAYPLKAVFSRATLHSSAAGRSAPAPRLTTSGPKHKGKSQDKKDKNETAAVSRPAGMYYRPRWKKVLGRILPRQHGSSRHQSSTSTLHPTPSRHRPSVTACRLPAPAPSLIRALLPCLISHLPPSLRTPLSAHANLTHPLAPILLQPSPLLDLLHPFPAPSPSAPPISTYRAALTNLFLAAMLAHVQRTLLPRRIASILLPPGGTAPLEHIRLARTNPDVFVAEALGRRAGAAGRYTLRSALKREVGRWAWEAGVAGWLAREVERAGGHQQAASGPEGPESPEERRLRARREARQRAVAVMRLLWVLMEVEHAFALGMDVAAWAVAGCKLLAGLQGGAEAADAGRRAFWAAVGAAGWFRVTLAAWMLGDAVGGRLWPLGAASWGRLRQGCPGLAGVLLGVPAAVLMVLRYRSTFFIALQLSGLFVFLAYIGVGAVGLAVDVWAGPMRRRGTTKGKKR
ncbi:hypothetical protein VTJ83DRAFT_45 [Remersonia thermophila]|uniref:GIY-YIG domain-containing protein n=1 Tax=Remersonia thermophila TaxID=72144 RepID=A0ABR4DMA5_9PEZI